MWQVRCILVIYIPDYANNRGKSAVSKLNHTEPNHQEKLSVFLNRPYRKPTQVGGCKYIKVYERTFAKELGKTVAVTSG